MLDNSLLSAIVQPLDKPCENLRYTLTYETIYEARTQEDLTLPQGIWNHEPKKADWVTVRSTCVQALTTVTKDLQLCGFLTEALLNLEGLEGLIQGLNIFKAVSETFWETLVPQIEEGDDVSFRLMTFNWLNYHLPKSLINLPIASGSKAPLFYEWMALRGETEWSSESVLIDEIPPNRLVLRRIVDEIQKTPVTFYHNLRQHIDQIEVILKSLEAVWSAQVKGDSPSFGELRRVLGLVLAALPTWEKYSFDPENDRLQKALSPLLTSDDGQKPSLSHDTLAEDLVQQAQVMLNRGGVGDFSSPQEAYAALEKALSYLKKNKSA